MTTFIRHPGFNRHRTVLHRLIGFAAAALALWPCQVSRAFVDNPANYSTPHGFNLKTDGDALPEIKFKYHVWSYARTRSCAPPPSEEAANIIITGNTTKTVSSLAPNSSANANSEAIFTTIAPGHVVGTIRVFGTAFADWQGCPPGSTSGYGDAQAWSYANLKIRGGFKDKKGKIKYKGNWKSAKGVSDGRNRGITNDPITARLIDHTTGITLEWKLFSFHTSLGGGEVGWRNDLLSNTSPDMSIRITLGAPITLQQGELRMEIKNGLVTELVQTGQFASLPLPPVGTPGSFSVPLPELVIDYDMGGDNTHEENAEIEFDNTDDQKAEAAGESLGSLVTDLGTGFDQTDVSEIPVGDTMYGFPMNPGFQHLADDFVVPPGPPMQLEAIKIPAYEFFAPGSLPFEWWYVRIWSGPPGMGGKMIAGDLSTNRLMDTHTTRMHRVDRMNPLDNSRRIKDAYLDMSWAPLLLPGQYWIEVAGQGNSDLSPVEVPPSVWATEQDNAIMYFPQFNGWQPLIDFGSGRQVGLPMTVYSMAYAAIPCPADVTGNGTIDIDDLVLVIVNWGQPGGPADVTRNGIVNIDDLVQVITNWGPCAH